MRLFRLFLILKISICLKIANLQLFNVASHEVRETYFNSEKHFMVVLTKYECERSVVRTEFLNIL